MDQEKVKEIIAKLKQLKKGDAADLSLSEDLSLAVMNLISLEEHLFFTAEKTGKKEYLPLLTEVRSVRQELMRELVSKHEGETWCLSKHLLAATMRLFEVGAKKQSESQKEEAEKMFTLAYKIYNLFWGLRLRLINLADVKRIAHTPAAEKEKPWTYEDIVAKLVDCCEE
jgi:hypothetical protein